MKRTILTLVLVLTATTILAADRAALERRSMAEYLNLSADQSASWENAERTLNQTIEPLARQLRAERQQLETLLSTKADACTVGEQQLRIFAISQQMRAAERAFEQQTQAMLTSDQKVKLDALHDQNFKRESTEMRERNRD